LPLNLSRQGLSKGQKNKAMKKIFAVTYLLMLFSALGFAQDRTQRADARQSAQRARIYDGRQDGELTSREASALNSQQRHIRRSERVAEADGIVTRSERRRLEKKQDRASRNIRRAKHNNIEVAEN